MAIKTYTIKNKQGEVLGELHFDPLSEITVVAYRTMFIDIKDMLAPLKGININARGEAEAIAEAATLQVVEDNLREAFDTSFGEGAYNSFFSKVRPFASQNDTKGTGWNSLLTMYRTHLSGMCLHSALLKT